MVSTALYANSPIVLGRSDRSPTGPPGPAATEEKIDDQRFINGPVQVLHRHLWRGPLLRRALPGEILIRFLNKKLISYL